MSRHIAALVLAAGASTRLGHAKQLVRFHGEQLVDRAVRIAREAGATTVFVVLGAEHEVILEKLMETEQTTRILINKGWRHGMSTSLALGVAAAERVGADDLLVLTCDQVSVTPEHLRRLIETSKREHVVASYYGGRRGIPALFPEFVFHVLGELTGDAGAREVLQQEAVLAVSLIDGDFDIDTPTDLLRLRMLERREQASLDSMDEETAA